MTSPLVPAPCALLPAPAPQATPCRWSPPLPRPGPRTSSPGAGCCPAEGLENLGQARTPPTPRAKAKWAAGRSQGQLSHVGSFPGGAFYTLPPARPSSVQGAPPPTTTKDLLDTLPCSQVQAPTLPNNTNTPTQHQRPHGQPTSPAPPQPRLHTITAPPVTAPSSTTHSPLPTSLYSTTFRRPPGSTTPPLAAARPARTNAKVQPPLPCSPLPRAPTFSASPLRVLFHFFTVYGWLGGQQTCRQGVLNCRVQQQKLAGWQRAVPCVRRCAAWPWCQPCVQPLAGRGP